MKKSILRETIVFIALFIIITTTIWIYLENYIPQNYAKIQTIEYVQDDITNEVVQEINNFNSSIDYKNTIEENEHIINSDDLEKYKSENLYINGNTNPFQYDK